MNRRHFLSAASAATALVSAPVTAQVPSVRQKFPQGVTRGVFRRKENPMSLDEMCRIAAELGVKGFDLLGPKDFPTIKKYGLVPSMVPGGSSIKAGINDPANHAEIEPRLKQAIDDAAAAGAPNVIMLIGDRTGKDGKPISDDQGLETGVRFMKRAIGRAEDKGITICLELLNSKVNHPGYMADKTAWGVEFCKGVGSPRMKLLYDIYHMQIMEGDVIRTIRDSIQYIGHFHTAGNPGRHEFDETQELNYRGIAQAIADTGYTGFVAHEYTPLKDPVESLKQSLRICAISA